MAALLCTWIPSAEASQSLPFETGRPISSRATQPRDITLFDVDGDGDKDVVVAETELSRLLWQENLVNGALGILRPLDVDLERPSALAVIDVLGDGVEELLVVEQGIPVGRMSVLSRLPGARLEVTSAFPFPAGETTFGFPTLEVSDADGDGDADVLLVFNVNFNNIHRAYVVFQGPQGNFTYVRPNASASTYFERVVAFGDIDGNGLGDLVMRVSLGDLGYVPQTRPGVFGTPVPLGETVETGLFQDVDAVDLDDDGDLDVVISFESSPQVFLHENLSGQGFAPRVQFPVGITGDRWLDPIDLDDDGDLDILVSANPTGPGVPETGTLNWLENMGDLNLELRPSWAAAGSGDIFSFTDLADWNGDGRDDLFAMRDDELAGRQLTVYQGQPAGGGSLALEPEPIALTDKLFMVRDLATIDIDGDGDLDILTASRFAPTTVALNIGPGRFERPSALAGAPPNGRYMTTGDVDGDGLIDALIVTSTGRIFWLRNRHDGTVTGLAIGQSSTAFNDSPILADVDGDGDLDVVAVDPGGSVLLWYEQVSPGAFGAGQVYVAFQGVLADVEVADMDSDGTLDVVAIGAAGGGALGRVQLVRGLGGLVFGTPVVLHTAAPTAKFLRVVNLDGTDTLDLVWIETVERRIMHILGVTGGGFDAASVLAPTTGRSRCLEVLPAAGGRVDLAVGTVRPATGVPDRVEFFRSTGPGTYAAPQAVDDAVASPRALLGADFDGDGDLDLVSGAEDDSRIKWYPGRQVPDVGLSFCSEGAPNSTGRVGRISAVGSDTVLSNDLRLVARDLPSAVLTLFLASMTQTSVPMAGGSQGTLCVGGDVGRFLQPGQVGPANADGLWGTTIDLTLIPQPTGFVSVTSGQTWSFQAWHRDAVAGSVTSNFTDAVAVSFI